MSSTKRAWKRMRFYEQAGMIVSVGSGGLLLILSFLHVTDQFSLPVIVLLGLLALTTSGQIAQNWRKNRKAAIISAVATVVVILFGVILFFSGF